MKISTHIVNHNYLFSTQIVTDITGAVTQAVLYAPFGEVITEYNAYWMLDTIPRYLFNAKELDEESGMYYYSARYYAPPTFISRDPLFEERYWLSPYNYCMNNPISRIDPTGMLCDEWDFDINTGDIVWVGNRGGDQTQYIYAKVNGQTYSRAINNVSMDAFTDGLETIGYTKNTLPEKGLEYNYTSQGTSGKSLWKKLDDLIYSIFTGGIWGTADDGQGQEQRRGEGHQAKQSTNTPDGSNNKNNSSSSNSEPKSGGIILVSPYGNPWNSPHEYPYSNSADSQLIMDKVNENPKKQVISVKTNNK